MATIYVGSARIGENGKITGGKDGDQNGKEVATQKFYVSSKGWYILRAKSVATANKIAEGMSIACANENIGYNQNERLDVVKYGVNSKTKINSDCSSLVRACCIYAGFDPGNFTTANEASVLVATKLFDKINYTTSTQVFNGDILVTKTKGHTVVVVSGNPRVEAPQSVAPVQTQAMAAATPTIKSGAAGNNAKQLQKNLNKTINAGLTEDGKFGPKSVEALKKWQKANGLTADGSYGPKSYEVMKKLLK